MPDELLAKRGVDLTGEDIYRIVIAAMESRTPPGTQQNEVKLLRGYKELAKFLQCSVPTASRMVARKDIHAPAVIRSGRTVLFNADLVLEQLNELDSKWRLANSN